MEHIIRTSPETVKATITSIEDMLASAALHAESQEESSPTFNTGGIEDKTTPKNAIISDTVYDADGNEMPADLFSKLLDNNNDIDYEYYYDEPWVIISPIPPPIRSVRLVEFYSSPDNLVFPVHF